MFFPFLMGKCSGSMFNFGSVNIFTADPSRSMELPYRIGSPRASILRLLGELKVSHWTWWSFMSNMSCIDLDIVPVIYTFHIIICTTKIVVISICTTITTIYNHHPAKLQVL